MDSMIGTALERSYEDFQPSANWVKEEANTLEVHLPEFKKEQLKIQIDNLCNMKITGERPLNDNRWSRFYLTFRIPNTTEISEIHAKFIGGVLYIILPKTITRITITQNQPPQEAQKIGTHETKLEKNEEPIVVGKLNGFKKTRKVAVNVALGIILMVVLGVCVVYKVGYFSEEGHGN